MKTLTALIAITLLCTGCTGLLGESIGAGDNGRVLISADASGMGAFWQGVNAAITNGKASPDSDTAAWSARKMFIATRAAGLQLGQQNKQRPPK